MADGPGHLAHCRQHRRLTMYVRSRLVYIGPKGFLAEWRAKRQAHASCRGVVYWDDGKGGLRRRTRHRVVVQIDEESSTCLCGGVGGQYVASRDAGTMLFKRETYLECESDTEAAEITRREWEDEYTITQGGGRWEWTTVDDEPGYVLSNGDVLAPRRRIFVPVVGQVCKCGHAREQHASDRAAGWAECGYTEMRRTNDGMDSYRGRCGCGEFRVDLEASKPKPKSIKLADIKWISDTIPYTPMTGRIALGTGSGLGNDTLDEIEYRAGTVQPIPIDPETKAKAMEAEIKPEIIERIRRARREWGNV